MLTSHKKANNEKTPDTLALHDYAMEATNAGTEKQLIEEVDVSPLNTPTKGSHVRKWVRPSEESLESILTAINTLCSRFDKQEIKLEDINTQIQENSTMIGSLAKELEFNAGELKECKSKVSTLEKKVSVMEKENISLKERCGEHERYSRRWNLRVKGMKESVNENTSDEIIKLLQKIAPQWAQKMDEVVDTVQRI